MAHSTRERVTLCRIGTVHSPVSTTRDTDWGSVESRIEVCPEYAPGLDGLEGFSHAVVVTFLHHARFDPDRHLLRSPQERGDMPRVGIFAQRAKDRPNPVGVTCVEILSASRGILTVKGLDAIDGTPVLDIKPHFPRFDAPSEPKVPEWVQRLMEGYF